MTDKLSGKMLNNGDNKQPELLNVQRLSAEVAEMTPENTKIVCEGHCGITDCMDCGGLAGERGPS